MVENNVKHVRGRRSDRELYEQMRRLRREADYWADAVSPEELASRVAALRSFVEEVAR
jgi:hypothetical protein